MKCCRLFFFCFTEVKKFVSTSTKLDFFVFAFMDFLTEEMKIRALFWDTFPYRMEFKVEKSVVITTLWVLDPLAPPAVRGNLQRIFLRSWQLWRKAVCGNYHTFLKSSLICVFFSSIPLNSPCSDFIRLIWTTTLNVKYDICFSFPFYWICIRFLRTLTKVQSQFSMMLEFIK